jgi:hypothetical protein
MATDKNRQKFLKELKAGSDKVLERIWEETGDTATLEWDDLEGDAEQYRLEVTVNGQSKLFKFSAEQITDYPSGRLDVDAIVETIARWIEKAALV